MGDRTKTWNERWDRWDKKASVGAFVVTLASFLGFGGCTLFKSNPTSSNLIQKSTATPAPAVTSPSSKALSSDGAAYAEFYRDQSQFVLIDLRGDGRSAVLLAKFNGIPQHLWSNNQGRTGRLRGDGTASQPKIIPLQGFDKNATVEFRTCAAEDATQVIEETCGPWVTDLPNT